MSASSGLDRFPFRMLLMEIDQFKKFKTLIVYRDNMFLVIWTFFIGKCECREEKIEIFES